MKIQRSIIIAAILIVIAIVVPRVYSGSVVTKYDALFWEHQGNGYAPAFVAFGFKMFSGFLAVVAFVISRVYRDKRIAWSIITLVAVLAFLTISLPSGRDITTVIERGNVLASRIESFRSKEGHYPARLSDIRDVPATGLVKERRFYYASARSHAEDSGPWFPSTRRYLGKSPYVICVPLVPGGTLVYRPDGNYTDMPGHELSGGWYSTSRD